MTSICGADCEKCALNGSCGGCKKTNGRPFGGECVVAGCSIRRGCDFCRECKSDVCRLRKNLIDELNALGIEDMEQISELNCLKGSFVNLEYTLPGGQTVKFWDDNSIYLGTQVRKTGGSGYYGIAADNDCILVCEYGENGSDAEIVLFKKRKKEAEEEI